MGLRWSAAAAMRTSCSSHHGRIRSLAQYNPRHRRVTEDVNEAKCSLRFLAHAVTALRVEFYTDVKDRVRAERIVHTALAEHRLSPKVIPRTAKTDVEQAMIRNSKCSGCLVLLGPEASGDYLH